MSSYMRGRFGRMQATVALLFCGGYKATWCKASLLKREGDSGMWHSGVGVQASDKEFAWARNPCVARNKREQYQLGPHVWSADVDMSSADSGRGMEFLKWAIRGLVAGPPTWILHSVSLFPFQCKWPVLG
jgi:hypothetical protein